MPEKQLFEVVANLVLQSVSVWEDMHLYALTYSVEYNTFWGLLDENLKNTICRHRKHNREERLVPFSMSMVHYYKGLLTKESFGRIKDLHWRKQLRIIMGDEKFRDVMTTLNSELKCRHRSEFRYLSPARRTVIAPNGDMRISARISCPDAVVLYNYV